MNRLQASFSFFRLLSLLIIAYHFKMLKTHNVCVAVSRFLATGLTSSTTWQEQKYRYKEGWFTAFTE